MGHRSIHLADGFLRSTERYPDRTALEIGTLSVTYGQLLALACQMATTLRHECEFESSSPFVGIFAERSLTTYRGILATLLAGRAYIPLNPRFPAERTLLMLARSDCKVVIADEEHRSALVDLLRRVDWPLIVILPEESDIESISTQLPRHRFFRPASVEASFRDVTQRAQPNDVAYAMFTSGSTGVPKGVMISHANLDHFLSFAIDRYQICPEDRLSQMFDIVFDLSVFDIFAGWRAGACVCVPTNADMMAPTSYIQRSELTFWFSVPSVASLMKRLRLLAPGTYPRLRVSLFCGEALTGEVIEAWSQAAPNSIVENLYGPTEVTLCCTYYPWKGDASVAECRDGVVPIGQPFPDSPVIITDETLRPVPNGAAGELLVGGPQVGLGYLHEPEKTDAAFVVPPGHHDKYYRTGDRVCREIADGPIHFLGRIDHQLKIRGNRVELGEIEAALRTVTGTDAVAAIGWPVTPAGADGIVAFVASPELDVAEVRGELARLLPEFALPRDIRRVDELPLNSNGKLDRSTLRLWCESTGLENRILGHSI